MKYLSRVPVKKLIQVHAAAGSVNLMVDAIGRCDCNQFVLLARHRDGGQWIPVNFPKIDLHRCDGELKRNATLWKLVYGTEPQIIKAER